MSCEAGWSTGHWSLPGLAADLVLRGVAELHVRVGHEEELAKRWRVALEEEGINIATL